MLSKITYQENCKIIKGYFSETAKDLDDTFAFVSIDVDLYKPTLEGLKYFYSRLSIGGYVFLHDFNKINYRDVREAVCEYCKEINIKYIAISNLGGSVIITK